jgi:putative tricarboxylic transport membrane protein
VLGLLAACIGADPASTAPRWTLGTLELSQGFGIVALMLGVFTFSELIEWMRSYRLEKISAGGGLDSTRAGVRAVFRHLGLTARASSIGTVVGMIPGVGGTVAGFVAYGHAVQTASDKSRFGQGDIRGLIAPEAAVDAKDGGSLLPAIAFGLPGSEAGVALLAVLAIHGIVPGESMLTTQLPLTYTLILALLFSNLLTSAVGVALTPWLARLRNLPIDRLALPCLIVSLLAVLQVNGQLFDLYTAAVFGLAGYFWRTHGWPRAPFVIAFVLGSLIETNAILTVQLVQLGRLDPLGRTPAIVLAVLIVASLWWMRAHRSAVPQPPEQSHADAALGLFMATGLAAMAAVALLHPQTYSAYARAVAVAAFALTGAVCLRSLWRGAGWRSPAAVARALVPPAEHRLPLLLIGALPLLVWALGLVAGVGVAVGAWTVTRRAPDWRSLASGMAAAAGFMLATSYFAHHAADLVLPQGWVWQHLN